jgi:hypothetical protein
MTTLVNALEQRGGRYGLQTMCEGGGMASATIIERLSYAASPPNARRGKRAARNRGRSIYPTGGVICDQIFGQADLSRARIYRTEQV